jgi:CDP-diacylglycerol--glycerol-3-phosphate 3-phosphatidyltransferase
VPHWPHESFHPHHIEPQARLALSGLQRHYHVNSGNIHEKIRKEDSVVILPVIQAGQFNIREEEACLGQLFDHLNRPNSRDTAPDFRPLLDLTSGYFGLFKSYKDRILRSRIPTRIICASPEVRFPVPSNMANSSMSFSLRRMVFTVPREYPVVCQRVTHGSSSGSWLLCVPFKLKILSPFLDPWSSGNGIGMAGPTMRKVWSLLSPLCVGTNCLSRASIIGIWFSPSPESPPILTLFGSTNLNSRSAHLDTELSFVMLANSATVQKKLQLELQGLRNFAEDWKGDRRNVRPITKILARLLSGYL